MLSGRLGGRPTGAPDIGGDLRNRLSGRNSKTEVVADAREKLNKSVVKRLGADGRLILSTKKKDKGGSVDTKDGEPRGRGKEAEVDKRRGDAGTKGGDLRDRLGRRSGGGSAREDRRGGDRRNSFDDLLNTAMGKKLPPRDRSRSPVRAKKSSRIDYDDPDNSVEEDTAARRQGGKEEQEVAGHLLQSLNGVSPLQGSKVVVTNLAVSVTQDDVQELFMDMGPLKRVKFDTPGHAEVTYVDRKDAEKAVERYNNVTLDGQPMKCRVEGLAAAAGSGGATIKLPEALRKKKKVVRTEETEVAIESIHKALFRNKKQGQRLRFTDVGGKQAAPWMLEGAVAQMSRSVNF